MGSAEDDELQALRRRAYGRSADIHLDNAARERLQELEGRGRPQALPIAEALPVAPAIEAPFAMGSHIRADEPEDGPFGSETPLRRATRAVLSGLAWFGRGVVSRLSRMRRSTVLIALGVVAIAATLMVALTLVQRVQPDPLQVGAQQVARLSVDVGYEVPRLFLSAVSDGKIQGFQEFHGLRVVMSRGSIFAQPTGQDCLTIYSSSDIKNPNSNSFSGQMLNGCAAGAFPAMIQFRTDLDGFPEELRTAFPDSTGLQFVYDRVDKEVVVFASPSVLPPSSSPSPSPSPSPSSTAASTIVDSGTRSGAQGTTILDSSGNIVGYVVASGDSAGLIAARFGLNSLGHLVNADGLSVGDNLTIIAGETLVLQPN